MANGLAEVGNIRVVVERRQAVAVGNRLAVEESGQAVEESEQVAVESGLVVVVVMEVEERKPPEAEIDEVEVGCVGSSPETDHKDHLVAVTLSVVVVCEPATVCQQPELEPVMACEPAMISME